MNNNIIEKDGEMYGFCNDLLEYIKNEIVTEIQNNNFSVINPDYVELLDDLTKMQEYDGIIKITDNNGMGWTAEKYHGEETATDGDYKKLAEGIQALIKLHHESPDEIAKYIKQYAKLR